MVSKNISQKMGISCLNQIQRSAALVVVVIQEHREIRVRGVVVCAEEHVCKCHSIMGGKRYCKMSHQVNLS